MNKYDVSIIVPIYNTPINYIEECVKSIQAQTWKSVELILVDDGSVSDVADHCEKLSGELQNCIMLHQKNQGVSVARNNGMERANGEWIMFADPDDHVEPMLVEKLLSGADKETDIVCCCCKILSEEFEYIDHFFSRKNFTFSCLTLNMVSPGLHIQQ